MAKFIMDNIVQDLDTSFTDGLKPEHLRLLRMCVKRVHMRYHPAELYSDKMADMLINKFGREYGEKMLKFAIDNNLQA